MIQKLDSKNLTVWLPKGSDGVNEHHSYIYSKPEKLIPIEAIECLTSDSD